MYITEILLSLILLVLILIFLIVYSYRINTTEFSEIHHNVNEVRISLGKIEDSIQNLSLDLNNESRPTFDGDDLYKIRIDVSDIKDEIEKIHKNEIEGLNSNLSSIEKKLDEIDGQLTDMRLNMNRGDDDSWIPPEV